MDYKIKGETLTGIANAIREKTGSTAPIIPEDMADKVGEVYVAGKDGFTDDYISNKTNDMMYAFAGPHWRDELYNPTTPMLNLGRTMNMFAYSNITDTKVPIGIVYSVNNAQTFQNAQEMVTIREFVADDTVGMTLQFQNCYKLKNLTMGGTVGKSIDTRWCPLTKESILSVLGVMSISVSGQTATFNTDAVNAAFTTDEWEALIAPKRSLGWTIALATA